MAPVTSSGGDNEALPTFAYRPLPLKSSIRILEVQPSIDPAAPLVAKLVDANIENSFTDYADFDYETNFEYEAVSYCWGEPLFTERLMLSINASPDKAVKYITANLRDALVRFRQHDLVRRLWVDAVCIDQENDAEKAVQIGYMPKIYTQASGVLIWLGNSREGADCFRWLEMLSRGERPLPQVREALQRLQRLPWFHRLWVVQELVYSTTITMFCGQNTMPWLRLLRVLSDERLAWHKQDKLTLYRMSVRWKMQYFGRGSFGDRCDLMGLLEDYDDLDCANEKDHLFAIAGLAINRGKCKYARLGVNCGLGPLNCNCMVQIEVDYGHSTRAIYMNAVTRLILAEPTNASRILASVACRSTGEGTHGPSWALDWKLPRVRTSLWADRKEEFCGTLGDLQAVKACPEDARFLILFDHFSAYGKVAAMLEPFPGSPTDEQIMDWLRKTWKDLLRWVHTKNPGIEFSPAKQQPLLEQLLDATFVLPHDLTDGDSVRLSAKAKASVRSYVTFSLYLQINDEDKKSYEDMAEMHVVDDDEESIALKILEEMSIMVQRIMRGRSVCIIDPFTHESTLVGKMLWPGLGIVPSHARPGDVVVARHGPDVHRKLGYNENVIELE
ncbi:HET-domain-containing protein [Apiospora marii]|uniref:HET-domain-containing protein n=1 Tax=Apiospora marii TaxID=335849 RepID=A0ABR1S1I8_9PEZI